MNSKSFHSKVVTFREPLSTYGFLSKYFKPLASFSLRDAGVTPEIRMHSAKIRIKGDECFAVRSE